MILAQVGDCTALYYPASRRTLSFKFSYYRQGKTTDDNFEVFLPIPPVYFIHHVGWRLRAFFVLGNFSPDAFLVAPPLPNVSNDSGRVCLGNDIPADPQAAVAMFWQTHFTGPIADDSEWSGLKRLRGYFQGTSKFSLYSESDHNCYGPDCYRHCYHEWAKLTLDEVVSRLNDSPLRVPDVTPLVIQERIYGRYSTLA